MKALFSELRGEWRPAPKWVEFLVKFGYRWRDKGSKRRRIAVVSMPSDTPAAGLIVLGALVRDLGRSEATNLTNHYQALLQYATQYLGGCANCDVRCHPALKGCGYVAETSGLLRHNQRKESFPIAGIAGSNNPTLIVRIKDGTWVVYPKSAVNLRIDGDPLPKLADETGALPAAAYQEIIDGAHIIPRNLKESFSGLCFAGRATGHSATYAACDSIRFKCGALEYSLPELLAVHGWSTSNRISRVSFFNSRTEQMDRAGSESALVVADGDASFLRVIDAPQFQRSDVIGVINRSVDRERSEAVGNRIVGLRQWFIEDSEVRDGQPEPPTGIHLLQLQRGSR
ncbi:hypothetical protein [Bradyrhizobium sp. BR 1433]|uniref:hypothetical protein n=1 Tax=Bradyrhizobium sp. BR 1433 TaxID=3447967 RepID=UPI003EE68E01